MRTRKIDLVPCPHCGCKTVYLWRIGRTRRYFAECNACHTRGPVKRFKFRARKAWENWREWPQDKCARLVVW